MTKILGGSGRFLLASEADVYYNKKVPWFLDGGRQQK